ncbi:fatty acid synthase-like [Oppia nitens]|uniref:fatty acid synthase-like n=1 Tax=Oppia nitens TaxID=1686743 RepID=UPI0023DA33E2|nr:fatty acid synthase-like [Oppia nitens]
MDKTNNEEFVISGISGRYPESDSIDEFSDNLYNNINMITDDERRFPKVFNECPMSSGKIKHAEKFDAKFFGVSDWEADYMDAQIRAMLETTYEAICDSGTLPESLSGSNTGVFIGQFMDEELIAYRDFTQLAAYKNTISQTLAFKFNLKGPTFAADTACASSFVALHEAYIALKTGQCDAALVVGVNMSFNPGIQYNFFKLNMISPDSRCMCLDEKANGYAKGEACVTILVQKRPAAKRIYATILNIKSNNDGYKKEGITFPSWERQYIVIKETYAECGIDPGTVEYMEAHCTGTKAGDPVEMRAIYNAMVKDHIRDKPLMIGALKSNIGHSEAASGLCAVSKVVLAFENEVIPANLHFNNPNPRIESLISGHIKPINKNTSFTGDLIGLNNFGFGGSNAHLILRSPKLKASVDNAVVVDKYPRLVQICGRNEEAVRYFFSRLFEKPKSVTRDTLYLVNKLSKSTPFDDKSTGYQPMRYRGFSLLRQNQPELKYSPIVVQKVPKTPKQLCLVYTGVGSQWPAMAKDLMCFDVCSQSISRSDNYLSKYNINLMEMLTEKESDINRSAINSIVSLVAIQIALTDLLIDLGLNADIIVGYSTGEIVCAYADKYITSEQALEIAYFCGKFIDTIAKKSDFNETVKEKNITKFLDNYYEELLKSSLDMTSNYESLLQSLNSIIITTKYSKSGKWIRNTANNLNDLTSNKIDGKFFIDSLLSPTLMQTTLAYVDKNAIIVEISPDAMFGSELPTIGPNFTYIPLMGQNLSTNISKTLLKSFGLLYAQGVNLNIEKLYPSITAPVSTGTRILSSLIKWDHSKSYRLTKFPDYFNFLSSKEDESYTIDFMDQNDQYIADHCIDGKILVPATGYLLFAWKSLAFYKKIDYKKFPVEFRDVQILRATPIQKGGKVKLYVNLDPLTGRFDIIDSGTLVATGTVCEIQHNQLQYGSIINEIKSMDKNQDNNVILMKTKDIYKKLRICGYNYGKQFQCIRESREIDDLYVVAQIAWMDNWVTFTDCALQTSILGMKSKQLLVPVTIELLRCDPFVLFNNKSQSEVEVIYDPYLNISVTNGLEIRGVKASPLQRNIKSQKPALRTYEFESFNGEYIYETQSSYLKYRQLCDELAVKIMKKEMGFSLSGSDADIMGKIPNEMKTLYNILLDMSDGNPAPPLETAVKDLDRDLMSSAVMDTNFLRSQLTVVLENMNENNGQNLCVVEVNDSSCLWYAPVMNAIDIYQYSLHIDYSVINSRIKDMDELSSSVKRYHLHDSCIAPEVVDQSVDLIGFVVIVLKDKLSSAEKFIYSSLGLKLPSDSNISLTDSLISMAQKYDFSLISNKSDCFSMHSILFRKCFGKQSDVDKQQVIVEITNDYQNWLPIVKDQIKSIANKPDNQNVWLIAKGEDKGLLGFMKCLSKEPNGHRVRCVQIMDNLDFDVNDAIIKNNNINSIIANDLAINVIKNGSVGHYVMNKLSERPDKRYSEHCFINLRNKGDLSSFEWYECQHRLWPINGSDRQKLVHIYYSALNFKDIMLATGRLVTESPTGETECLIGFEFTGRDEKMNRVMGMIVSKALATTCIVENRDFLWPVPEHWTLEEAATVPCVYATAYYALIIRGKLCANEKVLIHSGSGGVGQAAIRICLSLNCQLFITVGSVTKQKYLQKLFPVLKDNQFCSSRDVSFKRHIMAETNGTGVDIVLNSLSDKKLMASVECLASNGRFLEIGKYDLSKDTKLDTSQMLVNKTFHGIQVDTLFVVNDKTSKTMLKDRKMIWELISDGIARGVVVPLDRSVYPSDKCEEAFRFMASGKHVGKVLVKIRDEEPLNQTLVDFTPIKMLANPRTVFYSNKIYILTGGLGGMGLEIIDWMIQRGANKFVVTSRTGPKQPYQFSRLKYFRELGAEVSLWTQPISSVDCARDLLEECLKMGTIGGIFHLALVLSDGILENQTVESYDKVFEPKSKTLKHLDELSRKMCPLLDYFVVFSSAVTCHGNPGQTNYGFTNSIMERLCERRRCDGLPALAVQWGLVGDVGYVADNISADDHILGAIRSQRLYSCLQTLDQLLQSDHTICSSVIYNDINRKSSASGDQKDLLTKVAHILGHKEIHKLDPKVRLSELGMDSLMSVEIKQSIEHNFDVVLSTQEIQNLTIERIRQIGSKPGGGKSAKTNSAVNEKKEMSALDPKEKPDSTINLEVFKIPTEKFVYLNDVRTGRKIFYMPPTDGTYHQIVPIVAAIDRPVIGLNWTSDCLKFDTISKTAQHFLDIINENFGNKSTDLEFDIIGYSYGVFVSLEMCLILQERHYRYQPKLVALDMCPVQTKHDLSLSLDATKDILGIDRDLNIMFTFLMDKISVDTQELAKNVSQVMDKRERIDRVAKLFVDKCPPTINCGHQEVIFALETHLVKWSQALDYQWDKRPKLDGNVLLVRANQYLLTNTSMTDSRKQYIVENDYGFNKVCILITGNCIVETIDGNHTNFMVNNHQQIAAFIQQFIN